VAFPGGFKGGQAPAGSFGVGGGGPSIIEQARNLLSNLPSVPDFSGYGQFGTKVLAGMGDKLLDAARSFIMDKAKSLTSTTSAEQRDPTSGAAYDTGGIIPGSKGTPKLAMAEAGERVLPADLNASFEHLARSIDRWSERASSEPRPHRVNVEAREERRELRKLREEVAALREEARESRPAHITNAEDLIPVMLGAIASDAAEEIEGERMEEALQKAKSKMAEVQ